MKDNPLTTEVSAALVNYEVRRQNRLSFSESTTAEALAIRGRSFNRKKKANMRDQSADQGSKI